MNICPNLSNKQIKAEFDQLTKIFGEDCAYLLWDRSNGMGLKLAPNGASSKLYQDLLQLHNGDERAALIDKAKIYTQTYSDRFGDWRNDPEHVDGMVDENGEPTVQNVVENYDENNLGKNNNTFKHSIDYHIDFSERIKRLRKKFFKGTVSNLTYTQAINRLRDFNDKNHTDYRLVPSKQPTNKDLIYDGGLRKNIQDTSNVEGRDTAVLDTDDAKSLIGFLEELFPGIESVICSHEEFDEWRKKYNADEDASAFIVDMEQIYIDASKANIEIIAEEFFHPLVECMHKQRPDLYEQLLNQAKREFKRTDKILNIGSESSDNDHNEELLTRAISQYFALDYTRNKEHHDLNEKTNDRGTTIAEKFLGYTKDLLYLHFNKIARKLGFNFLIHIDQFRGIDTLEDISLMLNTNGISINTEQARSSLREVKEKHNLPDAVKFITYHIENTRHEQQISSKLDSKKSMTVLDLKQRLKQLGEEREKQCGI